MKLCEANIQQQKNRQPSLSHLVTVNTKCFTRLSLLEEEKNSDESLCLKYATQ